MIHIHNEEALQEFEALAREGGRPLPYALREFVENLAVSQVAEDPEISRIVRDHFWDIFEPFPDFGEKRKFL